MTTVAKRNSLNTKERRDENHVADICSRTVGAGIFSIGRHWHDEFWGAGKPLYDPGLIKVPTFLAHAEWDQDLPSYMLYAYFEKLTGAPYKRYVQIGEGTHTVIMEKNRMQLFTSVQQISRREICCRKIDFYLVKGNR